jgi:hypothetical protein
MENQLDYNQQPVERPTFLKVLCILSFISIGLSLVFSLGSLVGGPQSEDEMIAQKVELLEANDELRDSGMDGFADMMEQMTRMNESINANFYMASVVSILALLIGFYGVFSMWQGKKIGFHLYIVYSLISVGQLYLFVSPADIPSIAIIFNLIVAAVFVLLYSRNLHWMK